MKKRIIVIALVFLIAIAAMGGMIHQIGKLKAENADLNGQMLQLQDQLALLQKDYDAKAAECTAQADQIVDMQEKQTALQGELEQSQLKNEEYSKQLASVDQQLKSVTEENQKNLVMLQEAVEARDQAQADLAKSKASVSLLEENAAALQEKIDELEPALAQAEENAASERAKRNELSLRIMQAEKEKEAAEQEIADLKARILIMKKAQ
ncbi:MAG: hypothetical protein IJD39_00630 [Clostridia bacterium]|nr:hypothetical protein [Clostridia bacterium]